MIEEYTCPKWTQHLKNIPKYRIKLANPDTPINKWNLAGVPDGFEVYIKREDMTGSTLSGNKVRKLEFLMADALVKNCNHVITCGSLQSNHCRATAIAARQLGLIPHLVLRSHTENIEAIGCEGNILLYRLCGADIYLQPSKSRYDTVLKPRMEELSEKLKQETGDKAYIIPIGGGASSQGLFGFFETFQELVRQGILENYDDVVFPCASGATIAGFSIANYLTGSHLRCHGIVVGDRSESHYLNCVDQALIELGLSTDDLPRDTVDIVIDHLGRGYELSTKEELEFIKNVCRTTGILLDPVYSGKAAFGMFKELNNNPQRFKGKRILFLHTGGIFGMFDGRLEAIIKEETLQRSKE